MKRSIEKRKVIFGNPSLGTYGGYVYTYSKSNDDDDDDNDNDNDTDNENNNDNDSQVDNSKKDSKTLPGDEMFQSMVAITDVPPDQIPEGLFNLARRHRSSIEHIRVVVTDDLHQNTAAGVVGGGATATAAAADEQKTEDGQEESEQLGAPIAIGKKKQKRYLVLISFNSPRAATSFVRLVDGKPYNSFERDVIASVHHVAMLEGDGVDSVMDMDEPNSGGGGGSSSSSSSTTIDRRKGSGGSGSGAGGTKSNSKSMISPYMAMARLKRGRSLSISAERQNCAVCLEPMEYSSSSNAKCSSPNNTSTSTGTGTGTKRESSSIFTTVCNHSFHTECLLRCEDSPCPVCRYDHAGLNDTLSQCHVCGTTERIHVCLICGVASCWKPTSQDYDVNSNNNSSNNNNNNNNNNCSPKSGSMKGIESSVAVHSCNAIGHARQHYDETLHAYALDTETQHVWDFAGQGYVHRLIQNVDDGKIVEISDPRSVAMERSSIPVLSDTQEGEVVHRKLEGYASEYYTLLKSQLEQQRVYYEGVMEKIRRDHKPKMNGSGSSELIAALKQDRNQLQQRCLVLQRKRNKVADDVAFLKNMNESLEANKEPLKRQIMSLQKQRTETAKMLQRCLPALEEKLASLMLELENDE